MRCTSVRSTVDAVLAELWLLGTLLPLRMRVDAVGLGVDASGSLQGAELMMGGLSGTWRRVLVVVASVVLQ